jgi:hypothetical protein
VFWRRASDKSTRPSDPSRQSPSEPLTGPTPSATSADAWGVKRGWNEMVAPCYTCLSNIAAPLQYCKLAIPFRPVSFCGQPTATLFGGSPHETCFLKHAAAPDMSLKNSCLQCMAKSKTEETTYLSCTGTPSHAGTAGELTLHVAKQALQADLVLSHTEATGGLPPGRKHVHVHVHPSLGRQLTPSSSDDTAIPRFGLSLASRTGLGTMIVEDDDHGSPGFLACPPACMPAPHTWFAQHLG